jgi:hypothetical protein
MPCGVLVFGVYAPTIIIFFQNNKVSLNQIKKINGLLLLTYVISAIFNYLIVLILIKTFKQDEHYLLFLAISWLVLVILNPVLTLIVFRKSANFKKKLFVVFVMFVFQTFAFIFTFVFTQLLFPICDKSGDYMKYDHFCSNGAFSYCHEGDVLHKDCWD